MRNLLIRGARVVSPAQKLDEKTDLLIVDGKIARLGEQLPMDGCEVIEANGWIACPGLIDMHVHLRDFKQADRETVETGCAAAAAGGFTAVACMPNSDPVCDSPAVVEDILAHASGAKARVYPMGAITVGLKSGQLTDIRALKAAGVVAVTDDGLPVTNNRLLLDALRNANEEKLLLAYHAEDMDITGRDPQNKGIMHLGEISLRNGVVGVDRASEEVSTAGVIALAAASGTAVHIQHVSTAGALALVRDAKARGVRVTCETAPHYFTLTHEKLLSRDANFRMAPPLREESDRLAVLQAIKEGVVDCIATDHAPHTAQSKADFVKAPNGVIGLETSLALCLTKLVHTGILPLSRLIELMSVNPARLLGVCGGTLAVGAPADVTLFDMHETWTVDKRRFYSRARNTCFDGMQVTGRNKITIVNGKITYRDGQENL